MILHLISKKELLINVTRVQLGFEQFFCFLFLANINNNNINTGRILAIKWLFCVHIWGFISDVFSQTV